MKQSVADLHITPHDNQRNDAGTITGDDMVVLSKHQRSRQNIENKFALVLHRELYAQVVIATNANQPEPGNWHTDRQSSSNAPFSHHRQTNQTRKIRVVIARLANHPNYQPTDIIRSSSNKNLNRIFSLSKQQYFPYFQNTEKTAINYPKTDLYGHPNLNFPAFSHAPYLPLYTPIWTKNRRIDS